MTQLVKEAEEACLQTYKNRIKDLNNQAYYLYEKLNYPKNKEIDFVNLQENLSVIDSISASDNESVFDESKEFLINEIDVLQNKERILLDEVFYFLFN